ncbi:Protein kinase, partial [Coemansia sp. RSA 2610]
APQATALVLLKDVSQISRSELKSYCIEIKARDRDYYIQCASDDDLYSWMDAIYEKSPQLCSVSQPSNFHHQVHVDFDPVSGMFIGLPDKWAKLLQSSNITQQDYAQNPQAVLDVLEFYTKNTAEGQAAVNASASKMAGLVSQPAPKPAMNKPLPPAKAALPANFSLPKTKAEAIKEAQLRKQVTNGIGGMSISRSNSNSSSNSAGAPLAVPSAPAPAPARQSVSVAHMVSPPVPRAQMTKTQSRAKEDALAALTGKGDAAAPPQKPKKDMRLSTMSESQIMTKLKSIVARDDPKILYSKVKKIGQGASGNVYKARSIKTSEIVAIKQMDLAKQPRKELLVNEILVMKESRHKNIVNFIEAFLLNSSDLWVVMEYMEGGALTDVIDNNKMNEAQIATVCREVCRGL